jgi:hypothetical protein
MGRSSVIVFFAVSLLSARCARALDLNWSTGNRDLTVTSAAPCTLFVHSTAEDTVFRAPWRLVWRGTAEVPDPLLVLNDGGTPQVPGPIAVFCGPAAADSIAHTTTALFQMTDSLAYPRSAMYLLSIHPSLRARVTVAPLSEPRGRSISFANLPEVTINGGCDQPYPAVIFSASRTSPGMAGQRVKPFLSWKYPRLVSWTYAAFRI